MLDTNLEYKKKKTIVAFNSLRFWEIDTLQVDAVMISLKKKNIYVKFDLASLV
jgi:hypothetical protein